MIENIRPTSAVSKKKGKMLLARTCLQRPLPFRWRGMICEEAAWQLRDHRPRVLRPSRA
jgi:hypothetical protein